MKYNPHYFNHFMSNAILSAVSTAIGSLLLASAVGAFQRPLSDFVTAKLDVSRALLVWIAMVGIHLLLAWRFTDAQRKAMAAEIGR